MMAKVITFAKKFTFRLSYVLVEMSLFNINYFTEHMSNIIHIYEKSEVKKITQAMYVFALTNIAEHQKLILLKALYLEYNF